MNAPVDPARAFAAGTPVQPLGRILRMRRRVSRGRLAAALAIQPASGGRIGDVLAAHGWVLRQDVSQALAEQWGLGFVDLERTPPDPALLEDRADLELWLSHRILPWRSFGSTTAYVVDDPGLVAEAAAALGATAETAQFMVATPEQLDNAFGAWLGPALAARAAERVDLQESVRSLGAVRACAAAALAVFALAALADGAAVLAVLLVALFLVNAATGVLRLAALVAGRYGRRPALSGGAVSLASRRPLPRISMLVPLYRERGVVAQLVAALKATDYPRELLDVRILIEEGDPATRAALSRLDLPPWISVVTVPDGHPRTKPRAMNYALDFCRGDIVGILDAEDIPAPDQFRRVAEHLRAAPREVACVQCQLSYFNAGQNWITRCFQLEYAIWFGVLLRGFQRLGLPIPLGGTSVYFRAEALRELGGWDAHNVTEDADLGMRLVRRGMRCEMVESVTEEEANCRALPWVRQRSRWLKGYLLTWLSHIRAPARLWHEMGPRGFLGFNVLFLGGAASYLAMPLFWLSVLGWLLTGDSLWSSAAPAWLLWPLGISLAAGQAVMIGCAALAALRRGAPGLLLWLPVLPLYWTLGALAAWKAVAELFIAPYYWDKTRHGITRWSGRT